nr:hypothetical protein [Tanacetum cinerariifolium]
FLLNLISLVNSLISNQKFQNPTLILKIPIPVQDGNSQQEEIDIVTETDDVLPPSDDNDDDFSNDSLLGEADLFLFDDSIPSESRDAIFDENCFSSIPRPKDIIPNSVESQRDDHSDDAPSEIHKPRKEEDPRTYDEAMQSHDVAFWKEAIDDEIGSIMENNTWVLSDLPLGCKPLGFRQTKGIDYFDTYAPVARITTIRLLLALEAIYNLVIHQMDVKTAFLNGDLDKEVHMKKLEGFVMPVDKTKKFLSSRFSMKDIGEADVILGIKIKHEKKGILITQSHYIEKILKKFNREDCSPVSTPIDPVEKLKLNTDKPMDQLEYSRAISCLMYAMTSTRPDIAYAVGRLSMFTSNPSRQPWQAITRVFKYLKGTMNYCLSYVGYPSVLEGYSNAS